MTDDEIKAAITKGFEEGGLHPNPNIFITHSIITNSYCGCAQGALWIGLGNKAEDWPGWDEIPDKINKSKSWCDGVSRGFSGAIPDFFDDDEEKEGYAIGVWAREKFILSKLQEASKV